MARPLVVDSSVLIPFFARSKYRRLIHRLIRERAFRVSSVVCEELFAGSRSRVERREYREFFSQFRTEDVVTPSHQDWVRAGDLASLYTARFGELDIHFHENDILIVLGARGVPADILTVNLRHMQTWADFLDKPGQRVLVFPPVSDD